MEKEKFILDFIAEPEKYYIYDDDKMDIALNPTIGLSDVVFYRIDRITYEEKAPRKEALENVLSAMRIVGVNFLYLIKGDRTGVSFYYGISRDLIQKISLEYTIEELGELILKPSLEGNFRGSKITAVDSDETQYIMEQIELMKYQGNIDGVPGINEEDENFQGVDRLVDVMLGDEFIFLVTAKELVYPAIRHFEKNVYQFYDKLMPLSKKNIQKGENDGTTIVDTSTEGKTITDTKGNQSGKTKNFGKSTQESRSSQIKVGKEETRTETTGKTNNEGTYSENSGENESHAEADVQNHTTGENKTTGSSSSTGYEFSNKEAQEWLKYIDDVILKRIDYGKGKGMYISAISLFTMRRDSMIKLKNTVTALFSGESGNKVPLRNNTLLPDGKKKKVLQNFQIPVGQFVHPISENEVYTRTALSQYVTQERAFLGNWFSVNELSIIAGLPQKEIVGLSLREEVEFGLNYKDDLPEEMKINLGYLVQSGNVLDVPVSLDKREITKHIFVTGVTGSGKTTTCQRLLMQSGLPFLVIEPAKTEYRLLTQTYDDILIFTLGKDTVAPFRLNPFEFYPHESITSHVDMIKASIESAFDMEAAIPQIIEKALYECYQDCGWDILDNSNRFYQNPFAQGVYAFPTLTELVSKTEKVVDKQGFDMRLKNDYIGSIRARLQGLLVGSKGQMLNTKRSVDFKELVDRRVILELEEVRNGSEKALIMGFVISNLMEAIRAKYIENPNFEHITLVEEAHRLLSKYEPGDSLSKKNGVELFADMLAEVRKYGESIIIVDQIPGKLTPEVLKNTNTKIVHKIFAMDDKEAIGNTMALSDEQKNFLSFLDKGRAIVFSQGWDTSIQLQVTPQTNTTGKDIVNEQTIHEIAVRYYCDNYKKGLYQELLYLEDIPSKEQFELLLSKRRLMSLVCREYDKIFTGYKASKEFVQYVKEAEVFYTLEMIARYIRDECYYSDMKDSKLNAICSMLIGIKSGKTDMAEYNNKLSYGRRIKIWE